MPQDGDIHVMIDGRPIDLRVSTMPGKFGEKVVIRIIDNRTAIVPLEKLGVATDLGRPNAAVRHALSGCDMLVLEANHDEIMLRESPYPWSVKSRIRCHTCS